PPEPFAGQYPEPEQYAPAHSDPAPEAFSYTPPLPKPELPAEPPEADESDAADDKTFWKRVLSDVTESRNNFLSAILTDSTCKTNGRAVTVYVQGAEFLVSQLREEPFYTELSELCERRRGGAITLKIEAAQSVSDEPSLDDLFKFDIVTEV
ncbi:MAG: hypothetical protein LBS90_05485, partial [Oscillospiraceae bacterium]|nr:hypothetical protein [Oscillospiraceae bacterium]